MKNESLKIKVCGMTREEDVHFALSLGVDYTGFIVCPKSPRRISLKAAEKLVANVPEGKRVAVDVEASLEDLKCYKSAGFDYFQIHSREDFDVKYVAALSEIVGREHLWLAPRLTFEKPFPEFLFQYADIILLDTYSRNQIGGTGKPGDWNYFSELRVKYSEAQFMLAGGLSPENVSEAIDTTGINHVDVNSGVELEPGKKSSERLRQMFQVLRG